MSSSSRDSMSDSSNTKSSPRQYQESPGASPSQLVPHLTNIMDDLSCSDISNQRVYTSGIGGPFLRIVEQPQPNYRFRYKSEMTGTHGCLTGETTKSKEKTHPSVELCNYIGNAVITCKLVQFDKNEEHPHQLGLDEDNQQVEVAHEIGPDKCGRPIAFPNMGIIHTAKKNVVEELCKRHYKEKMSPAELRRLRMICEEKASKINLNIVRLKFSALHPATGADICPPVYSSTIHNLKSAATNRLEIVRMSRASGRATGSQDLYLFVEKVTSKDIEVIFLDGKGWEARGQFCQLDVHHQYAIALRTPPYQNKEVAEDVDAFIELRRPSDGARSARLPFKFTADPRVKMNAAAKKRKASSSISSLSSLGSSASNSIKSEDLPITVYGATHKMPDVNHFSDRMSNASYMHPQVPASSETSLGEALLNGAGPTPLLSQSSAFAHASLHSGSVLGNITNSDLEKAFNFNEGQLPSEELKKLFVESLDSGLLNEYLKTSISNIGMEVVEAEDLFPLFNPADMVSDTAKSIANQNYPEMDTSGEELPKAKYVPYLIGVGTEPMNKPSAVRFSAMYTKDEGKEVKDLISNTKYPMPEAQAGSEVDLQEDVSGTGLRKPKFCSKLRGGWTEPMKKPSIEKYSAMYTKDEGKEVKYQDYSQLVNDEPCDYSTMGRINYLVQDLCSMVRSKRNYTEKEVVKKLQRLVEIRLSNGDTFLHMTICNDILPTMEFILKVINKLNLSKQMLNLQNNAGLTLLHLVIQRNYTKYVTFLIDCGADPTTKDMEGNNAVHFAVLYQHCLKELLEAMTRRGADMSCIDAYNNEKQTPLHVSEAYDWVEGTRLLLQAGAEYNARDDSGRAVIHLAAYDRRIAVLTVLLEFIKNTEVDILDGRGNTALQILCEGGPFDGDYDIIKLLLEKGADPSRHNGMNEPAIRLVKDRTLIMELMLPLMTVDCEFEEIKSEPEDESADEDENEHPTYMQEVFAILDRSGGWRKLSDCLMMPLPEQRVLNPTEALFNRMRDGEEKLSDRILISTLEEIGETEAAAVVKRFTQNKP